MSSPPSPSAALPKFDAECHRWIEANPPLSDDEEFIFLVANLARERGTVSSLPDVAASRRPQTHLGAAGLLFANYEGFLQEIAEELNERSEGAVNVRVSKIMADPNESLRPAALPDRAQTLRTLSFLKTEHKDQRFAMASATNKVTWMDWHYFCYGVRCATLHGKASVTLCDRGCLVKPLRRKIRRLLQEKYHEGPPAPRCQTLWAGDMIVLLNFIETLVDPAESSNLKDGFVLDQPDHDVSAQHHAVSYAVRLWLPRMLRALAITLAMQMVRWYPEYFCRNDPASKGKS